jgi:diguanylate cyclase (GGDEF)-like protein
VSLDGDGHLLLYRRRQAFFRNILFSWILRLPAGRKVNKKKINHLQLSFEAYIAHNGRLVISLKKHIESYAEELARIAVLAYKETLNSMADAGARAMPHLGADLQLKLSFPQESLSVDITPDKMAELQRGVDATLAKWGKSAAQFSRDKAEEIKEIMVAVAATAAAVGERDQRYSSQFSGLSTRLQSIARLEDLSSIRRSVLESATELKTVVKKMAEEGEESLSRLRAEVANYRARLAQSEKREAVDPLTGLANRREIEAQIEERISYKTVFCLAILDLNGFKRINDAHGHVAGDDLLKQFAAELKARVRVGDVVGRWGGDEFIVVVDAGLQETQYRLDRIRQWAVGDYDINTGTEIVSVTLNASVGIAEWDRNETAVEVLARADQRMYAEKKLIGIPKRVVA